MKPAPTRSRADNELVEPLSRFQAWQGLGARWCLLFETTRDWFKQQRRPLMLAC